MRNLNEKNILKNAYFLKRLMKKGKIERTTSKVAYDRLYKEGFDLPTFFAFHVIWQEISKMVWEEREKDVENREIRSIDRFRRLSSRFINLTEDEREIVFDSESQLLKISEEGNYFESGWYSNKYTSSKYIPGHRSRSNKWISGRTRPGKQDRRKGK